MLFLYAFKDNKNKTLLKIKLKFERDKLSMRNLGKAQLIFCVFFIIYSNSSIEFTISLLSELHEIIFLNKFNSMPL